jgi:hypothetical protein
MTRSRLNITAREDSYLIDGIFNITTDKEQRTTMRFFGRKDVYTTIFY